MTVNTGNKEPSSLPNSTGGYSGENDPVLYQAFETAISFFKNLIPHRRIATVGNNGVTYSFPSFDGWKNPDTRTTVASFEEMVEGWESGIGGGGNIRAWAVVPKEHGLIVLDIDQHGGNGFQALRDLADRGGVAIDLTWFTDCPNHPCYEVTPRGGLHLWFKWSGESLPQDLLGKGLELLQDSCFVAGSKKYPDLPQTRLVGAYEKIPEMPQFLLDLISFRIAEEKAKVLVNSPVPSLKGQGFPASGMSGQDIFELARNSFPSRIEEFFRVPGARWKEDQYHTLNPLRFDRHIGSFSIRKDGRWFDFATGEGGDGIGLVAEWKGMTPLESAQFILGMETRQTRETPSPQGMDAKTSSGNVDAVALMDGTTGKSPEGIEICHVSSMKLMKPVWLVKDFIEAVTLSCVFGVPGSYKTFVALSWALAICSGKSWFGKPVQQGAVLYIFGEGKNGMRRRLQAWGIYHETDVDELPFYYPKSAVSFDDDAKMFQFVESIAKGMPEPPKAIFVDTLARSFGNGNENDTRDMNKFVRMCDRLKEKFQCSVILVHHSGHGNSDRSRGSSALLGSLDHEYATEKVTESVVHLRCTKSKDSEAPDICALQRIDVGLGIEDEDGFEVSSAVLVPTNLSSQSKPKKLGPNQLLLMEVLNELIEHQSNGSSCGNNRIHSSAWSERCREKQITPNKFHKAKKSLIASGLVGEDEMGRVTLLERDSK